jgi:hypothetical protein
MIPGITIIVFKVDGMTLADNMSVFGNYFGKCVPVIGLEYGVVAMTLS